MLMPKKIEKMSIVSYKNAFKIYCLLRIWQTLLDVDKLFMYFYGISKIITNNYKALIYGFFQSFAYDF